MKKKILSMLGTVAMLTMLVTGNVLGVSAKDTKQMVDGSYLIEAEESRGTVLENETLRGQHLMDGESAISKSGRGRIYAYGATTADHDVDKIAVIVYVDQYNETTVIGSRFMRGRKMRRILITYRQGRLCRFQEDIITGFIVIILQEIWMNIHMMKLHLSQMVSK